MQLHHCRKGAETAPLYLVFAAFVLLVTVMLVFPAISEWQRIQDEARTLSEAEKLAQGIDDMIKMGDIGSVREVYVDVPAGYSIQFHEDGKSLVAFESKDAAGGEGHAGAIKDKIVTAARKIDASGMGSDREIVGGKQTRVVIMYWADACPASSANSYTLCIK